MKLSANRSLCMLFSLILGFRKLYTRGKFKEYLIRVSGQMVLEINCIGYGGRYFKCSLWRLDFECLCTLSEFFLSFFLL